MKNFYSAYFMMLLSILLFSCSKEDLEFKSFLKDGEIVYPGKVSKIIALPGNLKTALLWNPSPDPSITKYMVYWNNKSDSLSVDASTHTPTDTIRVIINGLKEFSYTFIIQSIDAKGNRSIPVDIQNVRVFGPLYQSTLLNRPYNGTTPYEIKENGDVKLYFNTPDTININTKIKYTTNAGTTLEKDLRPDSSSITLKDYKAGTAVEYKSSYIPGKGSLDVFSVSDYSVFPKILSYVICDKSLFRELRLANDVYAEFGTSMSKLWDGSVGPQSYPNIFHTNDSSMPQQFTFDMGKSYTNLGRMEETGRDQAHNPLEFEVWGINDITNAATTLPPGNAGWRAESIAKGWTLLKDIVRTDKGIDAMKFELLQNPPPIRYIRIRVKKVYTNENYTNISELTFWNKE